MFMHKLMTGGLVAIGLAVGGAAGVLAAAGHSHDGAGHKTELTLNNGAKWETDDSLRRGMAGMRGDMAAALPKIHHGHFTPAQYAELAARIDGHIQFLLENCKLSPEADEQLHLVLVDAMEGAEAMKGAVDPKRGAVKIIEALNVYPGYFNHPGWQPLGH